MDIEKHTEKTISDLLEEISQQSEGVCPFCFADDFPVNGEKGGYDEVLPEDAEEWQIEHCPDCVVLILESAYNKIIK